MVPPDIYFPHRSITRVSLSVGPIVRTSVGQSVHGSVHPWVIPSVDPFLYRAFFNEPIMDENGRKWLGNILISHENIYKCACRCTLYTREFFHGRVSLCACMWIQLICYVQAAEGWNYLLTWRGYGVWSMDGSHGEEQTSIHKNCKNRNYYSAWPEYPVGFDLSAEIPGPNELW